MLSSWSRSWLACLLVPLAALAAAGDSPSTRQTAQQIAQWIEQLGDSRFTVRENASKKLWHAGAAAESALEKASKSEDPEVARRVRDLLDKFHWGVYPDTPADVVALIRAYQGSEGNGRLEIFRKLLQSGNAGFTAVLKIARAEPDQHQRNVLHDLIAAQVPAVFLQAVTENQHARFELLLARGHEDKFIDGRQYAAYWLLRGQLAERIADFQARLDKTPQDKWLAETLVYLHRANGDWRRARRAAEGSGNAKLLEKILFEAGDWKALAARPLNSGLEKPEDPGVPRVAAVENEAEKWAFRAAYARLAAQQKEFDNAVHELRKFNGEGGTERRPLAFVAAKALLLNDRPADAMAILDNVPERAVLLFDVHCARLDHRAAFKLAEEHRTARDKQPSKLDFARARILCLLGKKDEGEALFASYAEHIKDNTDSYWINSLLSEERRAGLTELALAHAGKALSFSKQERPMQPIMGYSDVLYLSTLFPQQTSVAEECWFLLRRKYKDESATAVLKRLRALLAGKTPAKDVAAWIKQEDDLLDDSRKDASATKKDTSAAKKAAQRQALAEVAVLAGGDDLAVSLLQKADTHGALLRLGDLLAAKKRWAKAAERYQQAWKKELHPETVPLAPGDRRDPKAAQILPDPLPLYLAGDALVRAGEIKEGKNWIEQAHWIPLADDAGRFRFLRALIERGHAEAARRETELLLRISEPNSYESGAAQRRQAFAALRAKDYLKAAQGLEQSMLRCLHSGTKFIAHGAYATVPAQIHQLKAHGLLAAGKLDEARQEIERALTDSPGSVELPIALVPELDRLGHKKEAMALFERCEAVHERTCRDYPRCAWAHNSLAWMSACCRRRLDKALEHAEKAVALAPKNAGYVDTLAEVYFQRGDKDKAIAAQKRAIELDAKRPYYRKQLKRIEAGDPKAERPPENEEK